MAVTLREEGFGGWCTWIIDYTRMLWRSIDIYGDDSKHESPVYTVNSKDVTPSSP